MTITHQGLLDAMDGIAMILDATLKITQIGRPNWVQFLNDNPPQDSTARRLAVEDVLGLPVSRFFSGDVVRTTFEEVFTHVLTETRRVVQIDFRCDAPALRREMRLSVSPIRTSGMVSHLLYQSLTLSVQQRPAIPLFAAAVANGESDDILTLCTICARVAWPIGAPTETREWIEPPEYYRRGGGDVPLISHGLCKRCFAKLREED